ncbi:MAG: hypothetical protein A2275_14540 [Bacteroidetes bacterium RIFOXYA12_FULL_35_11]|nr:MAG: hypothetical protein A2X01_08665 [Bacteroidetes bacterium GWF2_35_48]OFY74742.1 MAG: hypothetical protein A2275_14540 [Bacteroidetes bacterium RIFOXYA12_FULL_35_11]OFY92933.1 MAG: hypothetical protein A2491_20135 [Bacteroidetes bacterium RIFOXYC12_FULL_35_7]HBX52481.1 hypothetical protein [Bacteroidales bacterium]
MYKMKNIQSTVFIVISIILIVFILFFRLGEAALALWDESRLAVNAFEMLKNGNFFISYFDGSPDMWNTKPGLLIFLQAVSMKIFGISEFAVRLPSVLSALALCFLIIWSTKRFYKTIVPGIFASLILVSSYGFIYAHGARSADYDALFVLLTTAMSLFFYLAIMGEALSIKFLYISALFFFLAFMTKSVQALLFFLPIFAFVIYKRKLKFLFKNIHFYIAAFLSIGLIFFYYFLREQINPGYIDAVIKNEAGRFFNVYEGHSGGYFFYLANLFSERFFPWIILFALALIIFLKFCAAFTAERKNSFQFFLFIIVFYFVQISVSETKLEWYDLPLYPLFSIFIAFVFYSFYLEFREKIKRKFMLLFSIGFISAFCLTYSYLILKIYMQKENQLPYAAFIKSEHAPKKYTVANNYFFNDKNNHSHILFYKLMMQEKGFDISVKHSQQLLPGEIVLVCEEAVMNDIKMNYNFDLIERSDDCFLIKIKD